MPDDQNTRPLWRPSAATADQRLKESAEAPEDFAEQVDRNRERP